MDELISIADRFTCDGEIREIREFGQGNINRTYLVTLDSANQPHFILQRINTQVFRQPELVMQNMCIVTEHIDAKLQNACLDRVWKVPHVIRTSEGKDYWEDENSGCWRAIAFIEGAQTFDTIQDSHHGREIGYALGMFHHLMGDLPPDRLADTLPGFHVTPGYLAQYQQVLEDTQVTKSAEVAYGLKFVSDRASFCSILEDAKTQGKLQLRLMHGDPKINNVLIDNETKQAISAIDLDTVKPGLVHYDIGDCLRSGCNVLGEETEDLDGVRFEVDLCQDILQGYLSVARSFLTSSDYEYIYDAIRLITFELGLRFFTDYLAGNVYFKIKYPEHNLARALVQFKLTESIEAQEADIKHKIESFR
ncbi:phosphotransferase enzyme family protein [Merismopedia glauca]|uniref:Aminoglycoside phosphotransferase n=1 Tax=Merismopedia glauca CCAP 1448/3 TaxID=1296344 RepID=A0A2T1C6L1_9CYAN|nr:aminoglycoside phosphotransferase family protein [Merismopedia glauca]PSB03798.1 aminoglycoside phosphotransferase [Merismopedia glauca CCAP 1448/3]